MSQYKYDPRDAAMQFVGTWLVGNNGAGFNKVSFDVDGTGTIEFNERYVKAPAGGKICGKFYYGVNWHGELRTLGDFCSLCCDFSDGRSSHDIYGCDMNGWKGVPFFVSPDGNTIIFASIVLKRQSQLPEKQEEGKAQ